MKKYSVFTIIIFFAVSLFIALINNSIQASYNVIKETNMLHTDNAFQFKITQFDNALDDKFFQCIKSLNNIVIEKNNINYNTYFGKAIYFSNTMIFTPTLMNGRFISKNDFSGKSRVIVIGKNLINEQQKLGNEKYIILNNHKYLVVGVMGYANKSSVFDNTFYINFGKDLDIDNASFIIDGLNSRVNYSKLKNSVRKINNKIKLDIVESENLKSSFSSIIFDKSYLIVVGLLTILTLILNVVNTTNYYITGKKKEIGVRRAFGASKFQVCKRIIIEYQLMAIISFMISQIVYILIIKLKICSEVFGDEVMFFSTVATFVFILIIGTLVALISAVKSNKFQPNEIMKGL